MALVGKYDNKSYRVYVILSNGDWYESARCCRGNLYDNVISGGSNIIDDSESYVGVK